MGRGSRPTDSRWYNRRRDLLAIYSSDGPVLLKDCPHPYQVPISPTFGLFTRASACLMEGAEVQHSLYSPITSYHLTVTPDPFINSWDDFNRHQSFSLSAACVFQRLQKFGSEWLIRYNVKPVVSEPSWLFPGHSLSHPRLTIYVT